MQSIILIIGTRPEGIKLAPVYFALKQQGWPVKICATFQHTNLLQEVFDVFGIKPDFVFDIMRPNQDLFYITQIVLEKCKVLFEAEKPSLVIVQGDTTSAMAAALAAFYLKIPVAHVEAGLRTGDIYAPFPEELNRQFISLIARYNFAPTQTAVANLKQFGVNDQTVYEVGNTVVDALNLVLAKIENRELEISLDIKNLVTKIKNLSELLAHHSSTGSLCAGSTGSLRTRVGAGLSKADLELTGFKPKKLVLLTMHRRESFGDKMTSVLGVIKDFALAHPEVCFIFPVHPNPQVRTSVMAANLKICSNIFLVNSVPYHELVYILSVADCVATDSGGIQEEAASLGKSVILLRNETDRPEAVDAGLAWLVGDDVNNIEKYLLRALNGHDDAKKTNIYGEGQSANKIVEILKRNMKW